MFLLSSSIKLLAFCATHYSCYPQSIISWHHSPQFTYINFHISTCILHLLWAYYELISCVQLPAALIAQLLNQHCKGHGFKSQSGMNFFRLYFHNYFSCVHYCGDQSYLHIILRSSNNWIIMWIFIYPLILSIVIDNEKCSSVPLPAK